MSSVPSNALSSHGNQSTTIKHQRPQFTQLGFERSPVVLLAGKLIERRDKGMQQAFVREAAQVGRRELKSHRAVDFEEELAFVLVPAHPRDSLC